MSEKKTLVGKALQWLFDQFKSNWPSFVVKLWQKVPSDVKEHVTIAVHVVEIVKNWIKSDRAKDLVDAIVKQWELDTKFETEETLYSSIYIRDVNNYMAVKPSGEIKEKGAYANPWKDNSTLEMLKKNPTNTICIEAVQKFLLEAKDIERTIKECCDVRKFITIRDVDGGAVKLPETEYIGKVVRWYYAKDEVGEFVYARSGNKVPRSDGAKPIMDFDEFPKDIDYDWYVNEAKSILSDLGIA